jgi:hypothetical protein
MPTSIGPCCVFNMDSDIFRNSAFSEVGTLYVSIIFNSLKPIRTYLNRILSDFLKNLDALYFSTEIPKEEVEKYLKRQQNSSKIQPEFQHDSGRKK